MKSTHFLNQWLPRLTANELLTYLTQHRDVRLVLLRGLPGSGKSTFAKRLVQAADFVHIEADQHFYGSDGTYAFDPTRVADAHAVGQQQADAALRSGRRAVIANTHVRMWELAASIGLAMLHRAPFRIVHCRGPWENTHDVSEEIIAKMRDKWEPLPEHLQSMQLILDDTAQNSSE